MKIENNTYYNIPQFKGFYVSYNAEDKLRQLSSRILTNMYEAGKKVEHYSYVDLHLLSDLKFRIKEKGKVFSGIKEPIKAIKPAQGENYIDVQGIYDGVENENLKRGEKSTIKIRFSSPEEAMKGYTFIENANTKIDKLVAIAYEIERDRMFADELEASKRINRKKIIPLHSLIMSKFGNIVKEFKD